MWSKYRKSNFFINSSNDREHVQLYDNQDISVIIDHLKLKHLYISVPILKKLLRKDYWEFAWKQIHIIWTATQTPLHKQIYVLSKKKKPSINTQFPIASECPDIYNRCVDNGGRMLNHQHCVCVASSNSWKWHCPPFHYYKSHYSHNEKLSNVRE